MCGIVGAVLRDGSAKELISKMTSMIVHRGPDEQSDYSERNVTLGFARLSIIDPEAGHQPVFNEDHSIAAICNGEIYNYVDAREYLTKQSHRFNSDSDAEVIPHLYEEYGLEFASRLHGMFALSIHDKNENNLILARD